MSNFGVVYDLIPFIIVSLLIISSVSPKINTLCLLISSFIIYIIISSRGLSVDRDAVVYKFIFDSLRMVPFDQLSEYSSVIGQEIGFMFFEKLANMSDINFFEFRFLFDFCCLSALLYVIFTYIPGKFRLISYFIYASMFMLFRDFTQIRLCFACLLSIISILKILEGKVKLSISLFFIAVMFHNTSLIISAILSVIYFMKEERLYSMKFALSMISLSSILSVLKPANYLMTLSFMPSQLTRYQGTDNLSGSTLGINFLFSIGLSLILVFFYKKGEKKDVGYKFLYITMLASTCISLVFIGVPILIRMQILCFTGFIFFPSILYGIFMEKTKLGNYIFQISIACVFIFNFYKNLSSGIVYTYIPFWME